MRAVTRAPGRTLSSPPAGRRSGLAAHEGYWGRHACQALPARVTVLDVQLQRRCLGRAQHLAPQTITGHHPPGTKAATREQQAQDWSLQPGPPSRSSCRQLRP